MFPNFVIITSSNLTKADKSLADNIKWRSKSGVPQCPRSLVPGHTGLSAHMSHTWHKYITIDNSHLLQTYIDKLIFTQRNYFLLLFLKNKYITNLNDISPCWSSLNSNCISAGGEQACSPQHICRGFCSSNSPTRKWLQWAPHNNFVIYCLH